MMIAQKQQISCMSNLTGTMVGVLTVVIALSLTTVFQIIEKHIKYAKLTMEKSDEYNLKNQISSDSNSAVGRLLFNL